MGKKKFPGVDEQALQRIARNFPSTAPMDHPHFAAATYVPPAPNRDDNARETPRPQAPQAPELLESAPQEAFASMAPQPAPAERLNAPVNEPASLSSEPPVAIVAERPPKAIRASKFPVLVSLLALAIAAAPLLAPLLRPLADQYDAPQWLGRGIEVLGGERSLTALRVEALFAQEHSERSSAEVAVSAAIQDVKSRVLRLETSGSDLAATAARLDHLDEAVALAVNAQRQAEKITSGFATTLRNSEEILDAAIRRSEAQFLAIETAAREAAQGQLAMEQEIAALRRALNNQEEVGADLRDAIEALEINGISDRSELAAVAALAGQNLAALKSARDEMQIKVDLLNEQLAKLGDALEATVAMEVSRSNSAIDEALERAMLADDRARGLEARLSTYQETQLRAARMNNAVGRLGSALFTSEPFMAELADVRSAFAGVAEAVAPLESLAAVAPSGAVARSRLRENFEGSIGPQLRDLAVRYDASLWTRAYTIFSGQIGPTTPEGHRVWEVVAAAEKFLAHGDLANAVIQVARFEGPAGQIVSDWLLQARTRAATDKAFALLRKTVAELQDR